MNFRFSQILQVWAEASDEQIKSRWGSREYTLEREETQTHCFFQRLYKGTQWSRKNLTINVSFSFKIFKKLKFIFTVVELRISSENCGLSIFAPHSTPLYVREYSFISIYLSLTVEPNFSTTPPSKNVVFIKNTIFVFFSTTTTYLGRVFCYSKIKSIINTEASRSPNIIIIIITIISKETIPFLRNTDFNLFGWRK